jgi:hypothetical protein
MFKWMSYLWKIDFWMWFLSLDFFEIIKLINFQISYFEDLQGKATKYHRNNNSWMIVEEPTLAHNVSNIILRFCGFSVFRVILLFTTALNFNKIPQLHFDTHNRYLRKQIKRNSADVGFRIWSCYSVRTQEKIYVDYHTGRQNKTCNHVP